MSQAGLLAKVFTLMLNIAVMMSRPEFNTACSSIDQSEPKYLPGLDLSSYGLTGPLKIRYIAMPNIVGNTSEPENKGPSVWLV
jgi:hypothetical protein